MAERPRREPPFALLVPTGRAATMIDAGSAVVAVPTEDGWLAYYEGGRFGKMDWRERVLHAADRLATAYPTIAFGLVPTSEAVEVGTVGRDPATGDWTVTGVTDPTTLDAWSPGASAMVGASDEQRRSAAGRALTRGGSRAMMAFATARACGRDPVEALLASAR